MKVGGVRFLLTLTTFGRDKDLLRSILVGGVWNGFLLQKVKGQRVPCRFCGGTDSDGHLFGECPFPPLVEIRENPEFHDLVRMDKGHWPRCLLWHGWWPLLSGINGASPSAGSLGRVLLIFLSALLGGILLMCLWGCSCLLVLMLRVLLGEWLLSLMSGLMGAWWRTRSLVLPLLVRVVLLFAAVIFGQIGGRVIWMRM